MLSPFTKSIPAFISVGIFSFLLACGGSDSNPDPDPEVTNTIPVANAGTDQTVLVNSQVSLSAQASSDSDGDNLAFTWSFTSKPSNSNAALTATDQTTTQFTADVIGTYVVQLIANDGSASDTDSVSIIVSENNNPPIANAGVDQSVLVTSQVNLSAQASTDSDGDNLAFTWNFTSKPSNSNAALATANQLTTEFTADVIGTYVVQLTVNDGSANDTDSVNIIVSENNSPPIANAGSDQTITEEQTVNLNGTNSSDSDGDTLTYLWTMTSKPSGSEAVLNSTTSVAPSFFADVAGQYSVSLVVNDGTAASSPDQVLINYTQTNSAPVANAGSDIQVNTNQPITLDGSASNDAENDPLTFNWSLTTKPAGSSSTLTNATSHSPNFTADVNGEYIAQLIVNDGQVDSAPDTVAITASTNSGNNLVDDFSGTGPLLNYTTNNSDALPDVARNNGRYRANLINNSNDRTLHFNNHQGRLDAKLATFPFEAVARNIGIGTQAESQTAPSPSGSSYIFAGIQVHVTNLDTRTSSHVVVGHRGSTTYTVEGKHTNNGSSSVNDAGRNVAPNGRADIRIVGNANKSLTVYWQTPNLDFENQADNWQLYRGDGELPGNNPAYGDDVYIGLITYAQGSSDIPFVGTCDYFEIKNL